MPDAPMIPLQSREAQILVSNFSLNVGSGNEKRKTVSLFAKPNLGTYDMRRKTRNPFPT